MLCRYKLWQCLPRNNECAKPTPFYLEFCQNIKIMVAERKGVRRLAEKTQHTRRCPPPVPPQRGHEGSTLKEYTFNAFSERSATTDWQCRPACEE